jgi:N-acetylglucosamine-6-sulfatase
MHIFSLLSKVFLLSLTTLYLATAQVTICTTANSKPNFVLIMTDDQALGDLEFMPFTQDKLVKEGLTLTNAFVVNPLCCPSRVSLLRGQYPHNHGVLSNAPPVGGFPVFYKSGLEQSTLATWLQDAGYTTGLVGKYLNRYPATDLGTVEQNYIPPGWDDWLGMQRVNAPRYTFNENGTVTAYPAETFYATDVIRDLTLQFLERRTCDKPFFLYVGTTAPHAPEVSASRHAELLSAVQPPRSPSFNETNVSDKPSFLQLPSLSDADIAEIDERYRNRLRMLQAVDELVAATLDVLEQRNMLQNTYVLFTSDNGFHMGEHRLKPSKGFPFEEDIRVPLVMRGPGIAPGSTLEPLVLNIDLAPTLVELAGGTTPDFVDGKSFVPLLGNPAASWREHFVVKYWNPEGGELQYQSLRTTTQKYTEWYYTPSGERLGATEYEIYDLINDPYELENLYSSSTPEELAELEGKLKSIENCAGVDCP